MPRPKKRRKVCCLPQAARFGPLGRACNKAVAMTVDEFEAIRLIDGQGMTQEECAGQMQVARTTVQGIYDSARKKLAESLINGCELVIGGGDYVLCDGEEESCGFSCCRRRCGTCRLDDREP